MHDPWGDTLSVQEDVAEAVDLNPAFRTSLFLIYRWQCKRDCPQERAHRWHVVGLPRGGASVLRAQGRARLLDAGHVALHEPCAPYVSAHPYGCGDHGWNIALQPEALDLDEGWTRGEPFSRIAPLPERAVAHWRLTLERWMRGGETDAAVVEEATLELIHAVIKGLEVVGAGLGPRRAGTEEDHERVFDRARAEIFRRYREPIRLGDLARAACASPFHLCRVFKWAGGVPVHRYINRLRLLDALEAVVEHDVSLTDLALDLGFSSHSHFTHTFHRELGITPSELRRRATGREMVAARRVLSEAPAAPTL